MVAGYAGVMSEAVSKYTLVEPEKVTPETARAIAFALQASNLAAGPPPEPKAVALTLETEDGTIAGGLFAQCSYGWMFVQFLVVPEDGRGQGLGTQLMMRAEAIARAHGCAGIYLSTLAFQARGFYEKLGYTVFGELTEYPKGMAPHVFLQKRLDV